MDEEIENIDRCEEIKSIIKKTIRRRILEIKDDIILKKQLQGAQIQKINHIVKMAQLYHPIETHRLDLVADQYE